MVNKKMIIGTLVCVLALVQAQIVSGFEFVNRVGDVSSDSSQFDKAAIQMEEDWYRVFRIIINDDTEDDKFYQHIVDTQYNLLKRAAGNRATGTYAVRSSEFTGEYGAFICLFELNGTKTYNYRLYWALFGYF